MIKRTLTPLPGIIRTLLVFKPGESSDRHLHKKNSETYFIIDGDECEITIGSSVRRYSKNEDILIQVNTIHQIKNLGQKSVRILSTKTHIDPEDEDYYII